MSMKKPLAGILFILVLLAPIIVQLLQQGF